MNPKSNQYKSININFYSSNIPSKARLNGTPAKSVSNNKIYEAVHNVNGLLGMQVSKEERSSQRYMFGDVFEVAI